MNKSDRYKNSVLFWLSLSLAAGLPVSVLAKQADPPRRSAPRAVSAPTLYWWGDAGADWLDLESWRTYRRPMKINPIAPSLKATEYADARGIPRAAPGPTTTVVFSPSPEPPENEAHTSVADPDPKPSLSTEPPNNAAVLVFKAPVDARAIDAQVPLVLSGRGPVQLNDGLSRFPYGLWIESGVTLKAPGAGLESGQLQLGGGELHFLTPFHLGKPEGPVVTIGRDGKVSGEVGSVDGGIVLDGGTVDVSSLRWTEQAPLEQGLQTGAVHSVDLWYEPRIEPSVVAIEQMERWYEPSITEHRTITKKTLPPDQIEFRASRRAFVVPLSQLANFALPTGMWTTRLTVASLAPQTLRDSHVKVNNVDIWPAATGAGLTIGSDASIQADHMDRLGTADPDDGGGLLSVVGGAVDMPALRVAGGSVFCNSAILDRTVVVVSTDPAAGSAGSLSARSNILVNGGEVRLEGGRISAENVQLVFLSRAGLDADPLVDPELSGTQAVYAPNPAGAHDLTPDAPSAPMASDDESDEMPLDPALIAMQRDIEAHLRAQTERSHAEWSMPANPVLQAVVDHAAGMGDLEGLTDVQTSLRLLRRSILADRQLRAADILGPGATNSERETFLKQVISGTPPELPINTDHPDFRVVSDIWKQQELVLARFAEIESEGKNPAIDANEFLTLFTRLSELQAELASIYPAPEDTAKDRADMDNFLESDVGAGILDALESFKRAAEQAHNATTEAESRASWAVANARMQKFLATHPGVKSEGSANEVPTQKKDELASLASSILRDAGGLLPQSSFAGGDSDRVGGVLSGYGVIAGNVFNSGTIDLRGRTQQTVVKSPDKDSVTVRTIARQLEIGALQQSDAGTVLISLDDSMRPFLEVEEGDRYFEVSDDFLPPLAIIGRAAFGARTDEVLWPVGSTTPQASGGGAAFTVSAPPAFDIQAGDTFTLATVKGHIEQRPRHAYWPRIQTPSGLHPADGRLFWGLDVNVSSPCGELVPWQGERIDLIALKTPGRLVRRNATWQTEPLGNLSVAPSTPLKHGLVIVTHGTDSFIPLEGPNCLGSGLGGLAIEMAKFTESHGMADRWDVAVFDWSEYATGARDRRGYNLPLTPSNIVRMGFAAWDRLDTLLDMCGLAGVMKERATKGLLLPVAKWYLENITEDAIREVAADRLVTLIKRNGWTSDLADFNLGFQPYESARIGRQIGMSLADWLLDSGVDYSRLDTIHLLGHSSGSWVLDGFAERMKERQADFGSVPHIQLTYFDAFTGASWVDCVSQVPNLGESADTTTRLEHYVDGRVLGTAGTVARGVNIDVTWLDPDLRLDLPEYPYPDATQFADPLRRASQGQMSNLDSATFASTTLKYEDVPSGTLRAGLFTSPAQLVQAARASHPREVFRFVDPGSLDLSAASLTATINAHAWPSNWYHRTVEWVNSNGVGPAREQSWWDDDDSWRDWGFVRSPMYIDWVHQKNFELNSNGYPGLGVPLPPLGSATVILPLALPER